MRPLFFGLVLAPAATLAQPASEAPVIPPGPPPELMAELIQNLASAITGSLQALTQNNGLAEVGNHLTLMIFAIVFAWGMIKNMMSGDGINGIVAEFVGLAATAAVINLFLTLGGVASIIKFMDSVASVFGAQPDLGKDIVSALKKGFLAIVHVASMPSVETNIPFGPWNIGEALGIGIGALIQILARLITAVILVISLCVYIANIVLAHGSIALAAALAPVMIPFLLAPATSFIFDGWLKFTISSAMIKVVGAFMLAFTDKLMSAMVVMAEKIALPANADFAAIVSTSIVFNMGLILLAGLCAYLMMQVPGLANGLIRGAGGQFGFSMGSIRAPMPQIGRAK